MTKTGTEKQKRETKDMTAREFLSRYRDLTQSIDGKIQRIFTLRQQATSLSQAILGEKVQTSRQVDRVGRAAADIAAMIKGLEEKVAQRRAAAEEIERVVERVMEPKYRQVLERHYLLGQSLAETARQMGYSTMQVNRFHGKALEEVQKIIREHKF